MKKIKVVTLLDFVVKVTGWSRSHAKQVIRQGGVKIGKT